MTRWWPWRSDVGPASWSALADELRGVRDGLRAGMSLRQALLRAGDGALGSLRGALEAGRPLPEALRQAASGCGDDDLACALVVLGVQAEVGGDPLPAVEALEERLRLRARQSREARVLTAQARVSARAIIALTPGFIAFLFLLDPKGTWSALGSVSARVSVLTGLFLQGLGALWVSRIVRTASEGGRDPAEGLPVLRLFLRPSRRSGRTTDDVASAADTLALVLDAGVSGVRGLEVVAPAVPGALGESLRVATARIRAGEPTTSALAAVRTASQNEDVDRFVVAFTRADALGVPLAGSMRALADEIREAEAARVSEDVRRASVRVLLPLGLLVLPAFVLACLVPLFLGGLEGISL